MGLFRRKLKRIVREKRGAQARNYLDTLFDSFAKKDMTRRAFKRQYHRIMDPKRMARDAEEIALHNQVRRSLRSL